MKDKLIAFGKEWAANAGDFWKYHAATGTACILAYIVLRFLVK